ncbi:MAG TPA: alcohol dehydrogenase catalytic domain-containing protein [Polyangia bacterium]|jgi:hypothetical protein|nr:alcohol dehydrogenase catalytic domain-containing protein [Polyangia bacterium]
MRPESAAAAIVHATLTHQIPARVIGRGADALAITEEGPLPVGSRVFVPGRIPCGECAVCRRALCSSCLHLRALQAGPGSRRIDVPERFVVPIAAEISATRLIAAGLVAEVIGASARAGLGPGDTAIWMGRRPWARVGASWTAGRGCRTFLLSGGTTPATAPDRGGVVALPVGLGPAGWRDLIGEAEAAGGPEGGRPERRIFVCGDGAAIGRAAMELTTPGSTLSFLLGAPPLIAGLEALPPLRIFTGGFGHPDLIAEALAAIVRNDVDVDGAFLEVPASGETAAMAAFRAAVEPPIPVIAFGA